MKKKPIYLKIAMDLFWFQARWTIPFLSIVLLVHVIKNAPSIIKVQPLEDFLLTSYISSNIYMFIIGIISASVLLPFYVKNGISRKDYFKGAILGSYGLSLALVIASGVIAGVEHLAIQMSDSPYVIDSINVLQDVKDTDKNIIAISITGMLFSPVVDPSNSWILTLFVFSINLFMYYGLGWMIGAAFYRYKPIGFIAIALLLFFLSIRDAIWAIGINLYTSIAGLILLIGIILWIIYLLTKKVTIKL